MVAVKKRRSVRSVWKAVVESGGVVSYETFLRWVRDLESELVSEGVVRVGRDKRGRKIYVVYDGNALVRKLEEKGYVF
jgi:hypothetical protein